MEEDSHVPFVPGRGQVVPPARNVRARPRLHSRFAAHRGFGDGIVAEIFCALPEEGFPRQDHDAEERVVRPGPRPDASGQFRHCLWHARDAV